MFYEEIRAKQDLSYISTCSLSILYNHNFILMATSLGTNDVVVTRVRCINRNQNNLLLLENNMSKEPQARNVLKEENKT